LTQDASFRQYIGTAIILRSFRFVRLFWLFRSLWLSGRPGFPVVRAFRLFQLSGLPAYSAVVSVAANKRKYKRVAHRKMVDGLPTVKEITF
jgi:hypothetical protein